MSARKILFTLVVLCACMYHAEANFWKKHVAFLALMRPAIIPIPIPIQKVSKSKPHILIDAKPVHVPVPVHHHVQHHKGTHVVHHNHVREQKNLVVVPKIHKTVSHHHTHGKVHAAPVVKHSHAAHHVPVAHHIPVAHADTHSQHGAHLFAAHGFAGHGHDLMFQDSHSHGFTDHSFGHFGHDMSSHGLELSHEGDFMGHFSGVDAEGFQDMGHGWI